LEEFVADDVASVEYRDIEEMVDILSDGSIFLRSAEYLARMQDFGSHRYLYEQWLSKALWGSTLGVGEVVNAQ
jgi:hypothetical protein